MSSRIHTLVRSAASVALTVGATVALAAALPKLPPPLALLRSADSPGVVTFSHETHVDTARPDCTVCHPGQFRIVRTGARTPIVHDTMGQGKQCGFCHDGKKAFAIEADCGNCHAEEKAPGR